MRRINLYFFASLWLALWVTSATAQGTSPEASPGGGLKPFLLGGIQTHEPDHQRWMAALHQAGMNAVQVTVYAHQGPWNTAKLWFQEEEPSVLHEIRTARQNGLQVVLILRVALDHNDPENRFLWHGLTYPKTEAAAKEWFRIYSDFVIKWARVAEEEGIEVLGIASEMNSLVATLPVDELPGLAEYYLDDASQERLRQLVGRSEHLFTEEARLSMGAGDFEVLDDFLVQRNQAERAWARDYIFARTEGSLAEEQLAEEQLAEEQLAEEQLAEEQLAEEQLAKEQLAAINHRRRLLEGQWRKLIKNVRQVYSGRLTLAANFDNYHEVAFWDALDFLGINAYFPLRKTLETPVSEDGLSAAWQEIFDKINNFQTTHELSLPVVFTELGYTRRQGVTVAPWSSEGFIPLWDPEGETANDRAFFWSAQPFDPNERALAVRALHRIWRQGRTSLAGILYWKLSSHIHLQRFEPFMLYLGESAEDPLFDAFTQFADGIRPLSPLVTGDAPYHRAVDAILRDDLDALVLDGDLPPLLHLAVRWGRGALARHLVQRGAQRDAQDGAGFLPIHWACYQKDPELVEVLLPPGEPTWRDADNETPLMKCARLDNIPVAKRLLHHGDPIRARNDLGQSALHLAADQASREMIEMLMAHHSGVNLQDHQGVTPLMIGARRGDAEVVRALVNHPTKRSAETSKGLPNRDGNRPVHAAAYYGKPEVFQLLFEPDQAQEINAEGQSLLHLAAHGGDLEILQTLIPHFPEIDPTDHKGWTPLFYAIKDAHTAAVALLLQHGASVQHRANDGTTPLHRGASCRDSRILQQFLQQEVDVDLTDKKGNTALHHAAGWGHLENARLLLAAGANGSLRNHAGETALEIAENSERRRAARLLRTSSETSPGLEHPLNP